MARELSFCVMDVLFSLLTDFLLPNFLDLARRSAVLRNANGRSTTVGPKIGVNKQRHPKRRDSMKPSVWTKDVWRA